MSSRKKPYPVNSGRKKHLDELLIKFICVDFQPISVVEDKGFVEYSHGLDERYIVPCRQTVTNTLLPNLYRECKLKFDKELSDVK